MNEVRDILKQALSARSVSAWGIADIQSISPLGEEYPAALSILTAYESPSHPDDEEAFFHTLEAVRSKTDHIVSETSLRASGRILFVIKLSL